MKGVVQAVIHCMLYAILTHIIGIPDFVVYPCSRGPV